MSSEMRGGHAMSTDGNGRVNLLTNESAVTLSPDSWHLCRFTWHLTGDGCQER